MPPSQRWLTYGMPTRVACSAIASWACFLVPTKRMRAALGDGVADEVVRLLDVVEGLAQVDDVDAVALGEDEALHLRVPAPGLVPEVDTALQQLAHGHDGHGGVLPRGPWLSRPAGGRRPGARSPADGGPDEDRDQGGRRPDERCDVERAREVDHARWSPVVQCTPLPAQPPRGARGRAPHPPLPRALRRRASPGTGASPRLGRSRWLRGNERPVRRAPAADHCPAVVRAVGAGDERRGTARTRGVAGSRRGSAGGERGGDEEHQADGQVGRRRAQPAPARCRPAPDLRFAARTGRSRRSAGRRPGRSPPRRSGGRTGSPVTPASSTRSAGTSKTRTSSAKSAASAGRRVR